MTGQAHRERDQRFLCCAKCGKTFHQEKITHSKVVELLMARRGLSDRPGVTVLKKCVAVLYVQLNQEALHTGRQSAALETLCSCQLDKHKEPSSEQGLA